MEEQEETIQEETQQQTQTLNMWGDEAPAKEVEVAEEAPTDEVKEVIEEEVIEEKPITQEKIVEVEKIIEKQLEFKDDYSKSLYSSLSDGNDEEAYKYLQEKYRDYNNMADVDVIKMKLQKENPTWSPKDLDAEIKFKYGKNLEYKDLESIDKDDEPEKYAAIEQYNDEVERKLISIERDARDSRNFLNDQKKNIELPKIKAEQIAETVQPTAEEIAAYNKQWEQSVEAELPKLSDLSFNVDGEDVQYKATNEEKAELMAKMKNFSDVEYLTSRGWYDDKGQINILKVAEDVRILDNIKKVVSAVSHQSKIASKKEVISELKNVDLKNKTTTTSVSTQQSLADAMWK
jgi:hypothetical protein